MDEALYFSDDAKLFAEMIEEQWSLSPDEEPVAVYIPESYFMQSLIGSIYVYRVTMPMSTPRWTSGRSSAWDTCP